MAKRSNELFIVRYRRSAWQYHQSRVFMTERTARRLIVKLLSGERPYLTSLVSLELTRRPLGDEEVIDRWRFPLLLRTERRR